jgi:hypothetical protein
LARDLIIVRAGPRSLHPIWLDPGTPCPWDLFVCPYKELPPGVAGAAGVIVGDVIAGQKWTGLRTLLNRWQGWREYRYIILADDDLFALPATWSRFFERCAHHAAKLASPALAEESYFSHCVTIRNTSFVARRVSFIEAMMPCFRADVLSDLLPTLDATASGWGWGLDVIWAHLLSYRDIFIIDETPVIHTRPVQGAYSQEQVRQANEEMLAVLRRYAAQWVMKTLSGFDAAGIEVLDSDATFLYRLYRGYARLLDRHPGRFKEIFLMQLKSLPPAAA